MPGNYCVYKHTSPEGKVYIGITSMNPERRWNGGLGYARNLYFLADIMYFGWKNFKHEIIATDMSKQEAEKLEADNILETNSTNPAFGYNIQLPMCRPMTGGYNVTGRVRCIETNEEFDSVNEAATEKGLAPAGIRQSIALGYRCHGYHWEFVTNEQEAHRAG